jgi:DNA-nicking Smr family endonuclease
VSKRKSGFNTPFADLDKQVKVPPAKPAAPAPKPAPVEPPAPAPDALTEFEREMAGVAPLAEDPRGRRGTESSPPRAPALKRARDEAEAYAELADLIDGDGAFDIADTDEYIEGLAPGIDRRLLKRLKHGDYAVQAHLDLHGLRKDEAHAEVDKFISASRTAGRRCVLVVHGRGLNSKDQIPVLKERLRVWLTRGRIAKGVLAFATARPTDGGPGAVYILLRR